MTHKCLTLKCWWVICLTVINSWLHHCHGDGRSGNGRPAEPRGTSWGVMVRSTSVGDPKNDEGKCPPWGDQTSRARLEACPEGRTPPCWWDQRELKADSWRPLSKGQGSSVHLRGDAVRVDGDLDGRSTGAVNEVVGTAPGGVAGATETVHEGRGKGRARSRCSGLQDTARSRERARCRGERE